MRLLGRLIRGIEDASSGGLEAVAKYCCGMIYEDGEDTCMSCGEPL